MHASADSANLYLFAHFPPYFILYSAVLIRYGARVPGRVGVAVFSDLFTSISRSVNRPRDLETGESI